MKGQEAGWKITWTFSL